MRRRLLKDIAVNSYVRLIHHGRTWQFTGKTNGNLHPVLAVLASGKWVKNVSLETSVYVEVPSFNQKYEQASEARYGRRY